MTELVKFNNITVGYDARPVVRNFNFTIFSDSFVALVGPNGSGKTTIVKSLLGQIDPLEGNIYRDPSLKIGYLAQYNNVDLSFPISVLDVVLSGQRRGNRLFPGNIVRENAEQVLSFLQIADLKDKLIGELSGGQRQRVLLSRALMSEPNLLIMDEPMTYFDHVSEVNLYNLLPEIAKQTAIVIVSHDIDSIGRYAKEVVDVEKYTVK